MTQGQRKIRVRSKQEVNSCLFAPDGRSSRGKSKCRFFFFWTRTTDAVVFLGSTFCFFSVDVWNLISTPTLASFRVEVRLFAVPFSPGLHETSAETASRPLAADAPFTVIPPVCMHASRSPIRPYCANVCRLSSGRLEKDSYPYA